MNKQAANTKHYTRSQGFTLIEALVGVVVLSVGLLAIVSLQTGTMTATGEAKARSEATQIAEAQMELLRSSYSDRPEFNDLDNNFDGTQLTINGTNAAFTVQREVDAVELDGSGDPKLFLSGIRVSWQAATDADGETQAVTVASFINWDSPSGGAEITETGGSQVGQFLSPPTGRAFQGGRVYQDANGNADIPTGATENTIQIGDTTLSEGTYTYTAPDGSTELIDVDGRVLITIPGGEAFSTISGMFYSTESDVSDNNFDIAASDASACKRIPLEGPGINVSSDSDDYSVEEFYRCYVGPAWYGNIGIVRFGSASSGDRVCLGRPNYAEVARWDSLHPILSTVRSYRGFKDTDPNSDTDLPVSLGIGIDPVSGDYTPQNYTGHDFLLKNFRGNPDNSDCDATLRSNASLYETSWGEGFCFTGSAQDNSGFCPDLHGDVADQYTEIVVTISTTKWPNANQFEDFSATMEDPSGVPFGDCLVTKSGGADNVEVTCQISRAGYPGTTWPDAGELEYLVFENLDEVGLCSLDSRYPDTGSDGTIEKVSGANKISFSDIPINYGTIELGVTMDTQDANGSICP